MVSVPLYDVPAVGWKTTLYVHEAPTARVAPQSPAAAPGARENCDGLMLYRRLASAELPVFVTVTAIAELVVPITTPPKVSELGPTLEFGDAAAATNSTAPMSQPLPCGRVVPKKSRAADGYVVVLTEAALLIAAEVDLSE